ncbi:MAG: flagellar motor protein MotB [Pseudomonadota bacterium]
MDDDAPPESGGVPAWVMTFADLMTLLMCFFVLLLAFSEMDAAKFKLLSGSMKNAFGVQAQVEVDAIPKGTSLIATEFSPGKPEPTPMPSLEQETINSDKNTLDLVNPEEREESEAEEEAERLREALKEEIEQGLVAVETDGSRVIIHVLEKGSFRSGDATVEPTFLPVLTKIAGLVAETDGLIRVAGHTDPVPIANPRFRSNWELSAARAVSVAHELLKEDTLDPERMAVTGHADTRPQVANDTVEGRARNRRVEIRIERGGVDLDGGSLTQLQETSGGDDAAAPPVEQPDSAPQSQGLPAQGPG